MFTEAPAPQPKLSKSFDHCVFKGEGDAFPRKNNKAHGCRTLSTATETTEVQSRCLRGHKDTPITKLYLSLWAFTNIMTVSTLVMGFVGT
jgi:hypothetical protein